MLLEARKYAVAPNLPYGWKKQMTDADEMELGIDEQIDHHVKIQAFTEAAMKMNLGVKLEK